MLNNIEHHANAAIQHARRLRNDAGFSSNTSDDVEQILLDRGPSGSWMTNGAMIIRVESPKYINETTGNAIAAYFHDILDVKLSLHMLHDTCTDITSYHLQIDTANPKTLDTLAVRPENIRYSFVKPDNNEISSNHHSLSGNSGNPINKHHDNIANSYFNIIAACVIAVVCYLGYYWYRQNN